MRKVILIIVLFSIGLALAQEPCLPPTEWNKTYTYPWLAPCYIEVRDSAYFAGNSVMAGDLTVVGTITGTVTGSITHADYASDIDTTVFTDGKAFLATNYLAILGMAADVDTLGTGISAALSGRQPLATPLTQIATLVDSVTSGAADSVIIAWTVGKPDTIIDVR